MKRKIYSRLLEWKDSETRKPLLILGARQTGKTWIMQEFGRNEYDNYVYINCDAEPMMRDLFTINYDIKRMLLTFQAISGQPIHEGRTLIILDEIQEAPRGLHSLKYFCESAPGYHIMAAGSLLGVTLSQNDSFPVGKVDIMKIYPMDFEEFLMALGQDGLCAQMTDDIIDTALFGPKMREFLKQYYFVGGMPEVVKDFAVKTDLINVRKLQSEILEAYRRDISKHASKQESIKIGQVLGSLPSQLAKENRKFIYRLIKKGARAAEYETAIQWLADAGLIYKVPRVQKVAVPLRFYEDVSSFKLFLLDVGLLGCMTDVPVVALIDDNSTLTEFKGMMAEEYVAQQLASSGYALYYWSNDKTPAEVDFVIQHCGRACPVEVKSSTNVRGRSISQLVKDNPDLHGLRFSLLDYKQQDWLTNWPLWLLPFRFNNEA